MSVTKVYVPEGTLTPDQRRAIVKGIHDVINDVEKRPPNAQTYTYVLISEVPAGNWGYVGAVYRPT
jgi:phenylpyruvate tautomerase PptA (4-oxalocrotonate tautomerase family)